MQSQLLSLSVAIAICPEDWPLYDGHCYAVIIEPMTFKAALNHCYSRGSYLVSIKNASESGFLASLLQNASFDALWIGAVDADGSGSYQWLDGSLFSYSEWDLNEPLTKSRGVFWDLSGQSRWKTAADASSALPFICKIHKGMQPHQCLTACTMN